MGDLLSPVTINIFNIAKITSEVRGGKAPRIKRLSEYTLQKFDSDTERRFAVIFERDALKWFKPAKGQFQIFYKSVELEIARRPPWRKAIWRAGWVNCLKSGLGKSLLEDLLKNLPISDQLSLGAQRPDDHELFKWKARDY